MFGWLKKLVSQKKVVWTKGDLERRTKVALEKLGRDHGIELDRRYRKDALIKKLLKVLNK